MAKLRHPVRIPLTEGWGGTYRIALIFRGSLIREFREFGTVREINSTKILEPFAKILTPESLQS